MRKFEKISFDQFAKDIKNDKKLYDEYKKPIRKTMSSAGYDFMAIEDIVINPGEIVKIPTGIKAIFPSDEALFLFVRGSVGYHWNVRMCNQVAIVDSDFYNNIGNEGHMWFALQNEGDKPFIINKGDSFGQGVFVKYFTVDDEDKIENVRKGGFGSTDERNE